MNDPRTGAAGHPYARTVVELQRLVDKFAADPDLGEAVPGELDLLAATLRVHLEAERALNHKPNDHAAAFAVALDVKREGHYPQARHGAADCWFCKGLAERDQEKLHGAER